MEREDYLGYLAAQLKKAQDHPEGRLLVADLTREAAYLVLALHYTFPEAARAKRRPVNRGEAIEMAVQFAAYFFPEAGRPAQEKAVHEALLRIGELQQLNAEPVGRA